MNEEKKILLEKISNLISKKKSELLESLPSIHEIDDGIIIRLFTDWDNCNEDNDIKFKKIKHLDNPDEVVLFFFLPKGSFFEFKKRNYISSITCLSGKIEIDWKYKNHILESYNKMSINTDIFQGKALENTYLITTNK